MWEFRNRNTFGSTAFSTYGAFWLSLTALVAWYASAAGVANAMAERPVVPVGPPVWSLPAGRPGPAAPCRGSRPPAGRPGPLTPASPPRWLVFSDKL